MNPNERRELFECPNRVSLWLGNFRDRSSFEAYLDESAYYAGEESPPVNRFAAEFGMGYYDHDFQEGYFCDEGELALDELLAGISYGDSFVASAVEAAEKAGWRMARAFVLIYDFDYSRSAQMPGDARVAFIGAFDYRKA